MKTVSWNDHTLFVDVVGMLKYKLNYILIHYISLYWNNQQHDNLDHHIQLLHRNRRELHRSIMFYDLRIVLQYRRYSRYKFVDNNHHFHQLRKQRYYLYDRSHHLEDSMNKQEKEKKIQRMYISAYDDVIQDMLRKNLSNTHKYITNLQILQKSLTQSVCPVGYISLGKGLKYQVSTI